MKKILNGHLALGVALVVGSVCFAVQAGAQVTGQCSNCHTMHNSQDGDPMNKDKTGADDSTVYRALTRGDCVGCHSGAATDLTANNIPKVNHYGAPSSTLAGGSFYWVANGADAKGHNVEGIAAADVTLGNVPPGLIAGNFDTAERLTCAGTNGCHGVRTTGVTDQYLALSGAHHGKNDSVGGASANYVDGDTAKSLANSFRFLSGVKGIEDSDWEANVTALGGTDHNQYYGVDKKDQPDNTATAGTISSLCGQCHGEFHAPSALHTGADKSKGVSYDGTMNSPWVRHPTDFDMNNVKAKEYGDYGTDGSYVAEAPVASSRVASLATPVSNVFANDGDAIVTCISCHRAHGSANDDLLRWDYTGMNAHNAGVAAGSGCFQCHTAKDDA